MERPGFLDEYKTLRDESSQARQAQQSVLQWSLATFGLIFAAGVAFAGESKPSFAQYSIIYGLALPGLIIASSLVWWGEVMRMERAGYFMRGREIASWPPETRYARRDVSAVSRDALVWETYIAFLGPKRGRRKAIGGYLGAAFLYGGGVVFSLLMFLARWRSNTFEVGWHKGAGTVWAITIVVFVVLVFASYARTLLQVGKEAAGFEVDP